MKKVKYTKEVLEEAVRHSNSMTDVLKFFNIKNSGGMHNYLNKRIKEYEINTSHFIKQNDCYKFLEGYYGKKIDKNLFLESLTEHKSKNLSVIKKRLIYFNLKEHKCEICGNNIWNDKEIPLELHHLDGNSYNNSLDNLQLVCPNCHAQTDNYRGKKNKKSKEKLEFYTDKYYSQKQINCFKKREKINWPSTIKIIEEVNKVGYASLAKSLGVSTSSIKRRIQKHPND